MTAQVVLVRGTRSPTAGGGGCCSGAVRPFDEGGGHAHAPPGDEVVDVYRALRAVLPAQVRVEMVAPSNWLWLLPTLVSGGRRRGLHGRRLLTSVRAGLAAPALVVDGRVLFSGRLPAPAAAVGAVESELALA